MRKQYLFDLKKFCEIYSYIINNIFPIIKNDLISLSRYNARHEKRVGKKTKKKTEIGRNRTGSDVTLALAEHPAAPRPTVY